MNDLCASLYPLETFPGTISRKVESILSKMYCCNTNKLTRTAHNLYDAIKDKNETLL